MDANFQEIIDSWVGPVETPTPTDPEFSAWLTKLNTTLNEVNLQFELLNPIQWITLRDTIMGALTGMRRQRIPNYFKIKQIISTRHRGASWDVLVCWESFPNGPYSWIHDSDLAPNHPKLAEYNVGATFWRRGV